MLSNCTALYNAATSSALMQRLNQKIIVEEENKGDFFSQQCYKKSQKEDLLKA